MWYVCNTMSLCLQMICIVPEIMLTTENSWYLVIFTLFHIPHFVSHKSVESVPRVGHNVSRWVYQQPLMQMEVAKKKRCSKCSHWQRRNECRTKCTYEREESDTQKTKYFIFVEMNTCDALSDVLARNIVYRSYNGSSGSAKRVMKLYRQSVCER